MVRRAIRFPAWSTTVCPALGPATRMFGIDWWLRIEQTCRERYGDEAITLELPGKSVYAGRLGLVMVTHDSADLLLPDDEQAVEVVQQIRQFGGQMWSERFAGVPGGVDVKRWA